MKRYSNPDSGYGASQFFSKILDLKPSFAPLRILQELEGSWLTQKATPHFQPLCPKVLLDFEHQWS